MLSTKTAISKEGKMLIKTILNKVQPLKRFIFSKCTLEDENGTLSMVVEVRPRKNSKAICSRCNTQQPGYDTLAPRFFEFIPFWGIFVFLQYAMRRVNCAVCGTIVVEKVPWAEGKSHITNTYAWFLARWGRRLSWKEVADVFRTSWETVFRSVERAVEWGLEHRNLDGITAIGIDEISVRRGHKYLTLVYEIGGNCKRLLWAGENRKKETLRKFFDMFGQARSEALKFVCSDMWKCYLKVIAERAGTALNILDRFHIIKILNKAIDQVRAADAKRLKAEKKAPVLKKTRWCLLKKSENLTEKQDLKLAELLKHNLKTVRAYLLKEDFERFWSYVSPAWAAKFLKRWCTRVMRSRIDPMKKFVKTLRAHNELILNWFKARKAGISLGAVEGLNNKARVTTKKAYGFRTSKVAKIALYHALGKLPEPECTHEFC